MTLKKNKYSLWGHTFSHSVDKIVFLVVYLVSSLNVVETHNMYFR